MSDETGKTVAQIIRDMESTDGAGPGPPKMVPLPWHFLATAPLALPTLQQRFVAMDLSTKPDRTVITTFAQDAEQMPTIIDNEEIEF
jgi:hypothetical protein